MKAILLLLLLAATAAAGDLTITGPTEATPGETVRLQLDGLPTVDMSGIVSEEVEWFDALTVAFSAPSESGAALDEELTMTVRPFRWRYRMAFEIDHPGAYLVVVSWRHEDASQLLLHRIEAGGPRPDPPPPDPPPTPDIRATRAVIVEDGRTPEQARIYTDERLQPYRQTDSLRILDRNTTDPSGQPPPDLSHLDGPLPRILAFDGDSFVGSAELPDSVDGLIELLDSWRVLD